MQPWGMHQPENPGALRIRPLITGLVIVGVLIPLTGIVLDFYLKNGGSTAVEGIRNLTYPDAEGNVFVWYSSIILASIGFGFLLIAAATRGTGRSIWPFIVMAAIAFLLSLDEAAYLHERLSNFASALGLTSGFVYQWVLIAVPIAVAVGLLLLWLARALDPVLRRRLLIAGIVFLAGAVGGEIFGGIIVKVDLGMTSEVKNAVHGIEILVEETLEILGAILGLRAVLAHLNISTGPEGLAFELPAYVPRTPKKK
jgi:hypothetical protein